MSPKYYSILELPTLNGWSCKLIYYDSDKKPYRQSREVYEGTRQQVDKKISEWRKKHKSLTQIIL